MAVTSRAAVSLPPGSPGLKFLARFAPELRPAALECVTLYGVNALLNAYALEELTFDQLTAVTETACKASATMLHHQVKKGPRGRGRGRRPGTAARNPLNVEEKEGGEGGSVGSDGNKEEEDGSPIVRANATKKWPFMDHDGTVTDVLMGNTLPSHVAATAYRGPELANNDTGTDGAGAGRVTVLTSSDRAVGGAYPLPPAYGMMRDGWWTLGRP